MDLTPTESQSILRRSVREFAERKVAPHVMEWDEAQRFPVELLPDLATRIESARLLTYRAAYLKDAGRPTTQESSMAKLFASEIAVRAAEECVQIHGGYGLIKDYPGEKFFRDVKLMTIGEGTSEIQRLVIARHYLSHLEGP